MNNTKYQPTLLFNALEKSGFRLSAAIFFIFIMEAFAWNQTEFAIFTFFDPCLSTNTDTTNTAEVSAAQKRFQKAKDAYFNLFTGTQEASDIVSTQEGMDYALFIASKVKGLKYLVNEKRLNDGFQNPAFRPCQPDTAAKVTNHYAKSLASLFPLRRNALDGYNLGDEPRPDDAKNVKNWISHIKRNDNSKLAYFNLLPSYGFKNRAKYEAYLDSFLNDPAANKRPDVVCFDHYPFFKDGAVRRDYFYNLQIIKEKAGERPFWIYIQSVDHLTYVNPSAPHFRFMAFCPIAYGAKGLGYFSYEQPNVSNYRDALVNACTTQTAKYAIAQTINHYMQQILGPMVMNSTWRGAFHKSKKPMGEAGRLLTSDNAPCVRDIDNDSCLVGIFQSNELATTYYCLIVNKSLFPIHSIVVTLKGNYSGKIAKAPSVINYTGDTTYTDVPMNGEGTKMTIARMFGGEGQLYKITRVTAP